MDSDSIVFVERFDELFGASMPLELSQKTSAHLSGIRALENEEKAVPGFVLDQWK